MINLDYSQHQCPYPVVETRKQMLAYPGQQLAVLVGDQAGRDNLSRLAEKMGYGAHAETTANGFRVLLIPKGDTAEATPSPHSQPAAPEVGKTVIYCGSDQMGSGDEAFGHILMRNFITSFWKWTHSPTSSSSSTAVSISQRPDQQYWRHSENLINRVSILPAAGSVSNFMKKKSSSKSGGSPICTKWLMCSVGQHGSSHLRAEIQAKVISLSGFPPARE